MGRDAMGINHREGGRAPAMHRRQARETAVRGQMWMVELSVTPGGWLVWSGFPVGPFTN